MKQFIYGNDEAFRALEEQAKFACVRFRDQEMPPGCNPEKADVGFEVNPDSGSAKLFVSLGVKYNGNNSTVVEWFNSGTKEFPSFEALKQWIKTSLNSTFQNTNATDDQLLGGIGGNTHSSQLTDIPAVHEAMRTIHRPLYLDEEKLFMEHSKLVLGQEDALRSLEAVIVRHCARTKPSRPAVIFAIGPSGVGKTRAAETLVQVLREMDAEETEYGFLRLDMSEYQEAHRVSQLIGAPQGYIGHGEGSQLVDALQSNPKMIVLFDEIEKAHPAIHRVLMNAMDAGRLSTAALSSMGREIDCKHAVFIFTSNLNSKEILDELENRDAFGNRAIEDEVCRRRLRASGIAPEIVGRIGRFLVFKPLSPETKAEIVVLAVVEVAKEYGVDIAYVHPNIIIDLMKQIKSDDFGVRPERFLIDDFLGGAFAKAAENQIPNPVEVVGIPYRCEAYNVAERNSIEENADTK